MTTETEFQKKAASLSHLAHVMRNTLETHHGTPFQNAFGRDLAAQMKPIIAAYDRAVFEARSREQAAEALSDLTRLIDYACASASKGEMGFALSPALDAFHELHTVFRESRYRDEVL